MFERLKFPNLILVIPSAEKEQCFHGELFQKLDSPACHLLMCLISVNCCLFRAESSGDSDLEADIEQEGDKLLVCHRHKG